MRVHKKTVVVCSNLWLSPHKSSGMVGLSPPCRTRIDKTDFGFTFTLMRIIDNLV